MKYDSELDYKTDKEPWKTESVFLVRNFVLVQILFLSDWPIQYRLYIEFRKCLHSIYTFSLNYSRETESLSNWYTCNPVMAVDLVNFSSSQVKFHLYSQLYDLMRVGRERCACYLQGPCCEIKGHSHWMSNPNSYLFSLWPMGKSNAIRIERRPLSLRSLSSKSSPRPRSII